VRKPSCANCACYVSIKSEARPAERGQCTRYPPQLVVTSRRLTASDGPDALQNFFPEVAGEWHCYEHRPAKRARQVRQ
jgi:hypothetical protein